MTSRCWREVMQIMLGETIREDCPVSEVNVTIPPFQSHLEHQILYQSDEAIAA